MIIGLAVMCTLTNCHQFYMHLCICPVIDHNFCHIIVKVAVEGDTRSGSADYSDIVMTKFIATNRTDALKTDVNLIFSMTNCQVLCSRMLMQCINAKFMCLSTY